MSELRYTATVAHVTPQCESKLATMTRICYASEGKATPESDAALLRNCLKQGHHDTLRHAYLIADVTFEATPERLIAWSDLTHTYRHLHVTRYDEPLLRDRYGLISYRVSGNFQTWREIYLASYRAWLLELEDALDPIFQRLQVEAPNVFNDPEWDYRPTPIPPYEVRMIGAGDPQKIHTGASVLLEDHYDDPVSPIHSYTTFWGEFDRATSAQLNRHAWDGILQQSQRYVDQSTVPFLWPPVPYLDETTRPTAQELFLVLGDHVRRTYQDLRQLGVRKEDARSVLPMATATEQHYTGRAPVIDNFLTLRLAKKAQLHLIRTVAESMNRVRERARIRQALEYT